MGNTARKTLYIFACLLIASVAFSQETFNENPFLSYMDWEIPIDTAVMCIVSESTGFNWKNGRWVRSRFAEKKYILKKLDHRRQSGSYSFREAESPLPEAFSCLLDLDGKKDLLTYEHVTGKASDFATLNRCYGFAELCHPPRVYFFRNA